MFGSVRHRPGNPPTADLPDTPSIASADARWGDLGETLGADRHKEAEPPSVTHPTELRATRTVWPTGGTGMVR
jgi:hypothetical protein